MKEKRKVVLMVVVLFFGLCVTPSIIGIEKADSIFNSNILLEEYYTLNTTIIPNTPSPEDGAIDVDADADLSWEGGHPTLIPNYRIYFSTTEWTGESPSGNLIGGCPGFPPAPEYRDTTWELDTLEYEITYYWQIYSQIGGCSGPPPQDPIWGPVWSFTTAGQPTIVCIEPPIKIVENGETFDLYVYIDVPVEPICSAGIEFIYFDETLLQVDAVEFQGFFDPYSTGTDYTIDNPIGEIRYIYEYTTKAETVQTAGNFMKITFTADEINLGYTTIDLVNVDLLQPGAVPIPVEVYDGEVIFFPPPPPTIEIIGCGEVEPPYIPPCPPGTVIELLAIPCSGWHFLEWSGDISSFDNPILLTLDHDIQHIIAIFIEDQYTLNVTIIGSGTVIRDPDKPYYVYGEEVELTAVADLGWDFDYWQGDIADPNSAITNITMNANKEVTAWFSVTPIYLCIDIVGNGHVDVVPDKEWYRYGEEPELIAVADIGWSFDSWSGDLNGSENPTTIFMDGYKEVTATFIEDDIISPVTTIDFGKPYYKDIEGNIYITSDTPIYLNATDDESGVNTTYYKINDGKWGKYAAPFSIPDDCNHAIYFYSVDNASNEESIRNKNVSVDNCPPYYELSPPWPNGNNGWYNSSVFVSFVDAKSSFIYVQYKINDGAWMVYVEPFIIGGDGYHTVDYYAVDNVGNEGTGSFSIKIDQIPPTTTHEFEGIVGDNDWFVSDVMIILNVEDETSGVDYTMYKVDNGEWITYTGPFNVCGDGMHILYYYSVDRAGNEKDVNEADFKIDQTDPTIWLTAEKIYPNTWRLMADVYDETSGISRVEFYVNNELVGGVIEPPYEWIYNHRLSIRGLILNPKITEETVSFFAVMTIYSIFDYPVAQAIVYDNAGNEGTSIPHPPINNNRFGIYLFQQLTFQNSYSGNIGRFFINAVF